MARRASETAELAAEVRTEEWMAEEGEAVDRETWPSTLTRV